MAFLTVTVTEDYRDDSLSLVSNIFFSTSAASIATFNSSQFGGTGILDDVGIDGDGNKNTIDVHTLSDALFSAAGWTFTNWSANDDVRIFGTSAAETITGSSKPNQIRGGGGADILTGGASNDLFSYSSASDIVAGETVDGLGGADEILLLNAVSYDFSGATLTSIATLSFGNAGTAMLAGGHIGGGAIATVEGDTLAQALIVNGSSVNLGAVTFTDWTLGTDTITINGAAGNDSLTGSSQRDTLNGGGNQDTLNGGAEADTLNGEAGNDTLDGGAGLDTLNGGLGDDTYVLGAATDTVTDTGGTADTITSTISRSLSAFASIENLTLLGAAANATGNGLANLLKGNGSANTLDGMSGGDTMRGLAGNDTYVVRNANDVVDESVGGSGGTDTILAHVNYSLTAALGSVENLTLLGVTALNATGNGIANTITGNAVANTLDGAAGGDTMRGVGGNDTYVVDNIGDVVDESAAGSDGTDTALSSVNLDLGGGAAKFVSLAAAASGLGAVENVTLTGSAIEATGNDLANVITANGAANRLTGGLGVDTFTGGGGADAFIFLSIEDTGKKTSTCDIILDFTASDFIDLSAIDAKKGGTDNKFKFIGKDDFHDKKGELHYQKKKGDVLVSGDVNGDGKADFAILLDAVNKIAKSDFEL